MTVGIVFVSHSVKLAEGMTELAGQMAAGVTLVAAGGTDDGSLGTSYDKIESAATAANSGDGVVLICDLGSAELTADTYLDTLDEDEKVVRSHGEFVKGGVAAAVAAAAGDDLDQVLAAANGDEPAAPSAPASIAADASGAVTGTVEVVNEQGLHARPAAEFVKAASGYDAAITVNGVDAKSLLGIMAMGARRGTTLEISATGSQAHEAVDGLIDLVRSGFDE